MPGPGRTAGTPGLGRHPARRREPGPGRARRRARRALALAWIGGYDLALLATASHAALLIQAQPWRRLWLLKLGALIALCMLFARHWRGSAADRWMLLALAAAALTAQRRPVALALALLAQRAWTASKLPQLPRWLPLAGGIALALVLLELLGGPGPAGSRHGPAFD